jgi:hypothetical protein
MDAPLPAPVETVPDKLARTMPGGPIPEGGDAEVHPPVNHLVTPNADLPSPLEPIPELPMLAREASPLTEGERQETPLDPGQSEVQAAHEAPQLQPDASREAVLPNVDQAEILSKTNALLEMISSIQQKLEDLPSVAPVSTDQQEMPQDRELGPAVLLSDPVSAPEHGGAGIDHREQVSSSPQITRVADLRYSLIIS